LNLVARDPKTISQLAGALGLSAPSIHKHVSEMTDSELLRESTERERKHPAERYFEPNFLVIKADDHAQFDVLCREMAAQIADLFENNRPRLERALNDTSVINRGWAFPDLAQYLYAKTQRCARELLEQRGALPPDKSTRMAQSGSSGLKNQRLTQIISA
jgi:DNA-binding transcriptional ArsR family regulator